MNAFPGSGSRSPSRVEPRPSLARPMGGRSTCCSPRPKAAWMIPTALAGYVYGALIPNYGGYLCYIGVADWARRMGVGTRLFDQFFRQMAVDAGELGAPLPFVIWESHRPKPEAPAAEWDLWAARTKLFDRVGGLWVEGVDFLSPNFAQRGGQMPRRCRCNCSSSRWPSRRARSTRTPEAGGGGAAPRGLPQRAGRCSVRPDAAARIVSPPAARQAGRPSSESCWLNPSTKSESDGFRISCFGFRISESKSGGNRTHASAHIRRGPCHLATDPGERGSPLLAGFRGWLEVIAWEHGRDVPASRGCPSFPGSSGGTRLARLCLVDEWAETKSLRRDLGRA